STVNRNVPGSSPGRGATNIVILFSHILYTFVLITILFVTIIEINEKPLLLIAERVILKITLRSEELWNQLLLLMIMRV
ncbi:MAG: hypothetical protein P8J51_03700, partial [Dehalococcoidia bacterium]|nr:hypothetical protein [Dehalococcoidia bacterium]